MTSIPPCDLTGDMFDGSWDYSATRIKHGASGKEILPATTANAQAAQLKRVGGAIGRDVLRFCREALASGVPEFYGDALRRYVERKGHRAPDSAGRILRLLRQEGRLDYEVINRAASLYRIISLEEEQA